MISEAKLPRVRFHDLAAYARDDLALARRSSENRIRTSRPLYRRHTLDTYSHVLPGMQEKAAAEIDAALALPG